MMNADIHTLLSSFSPITLDEMNDIRLMNRIDTKYVTTTDALCSLLDRLSSYYRLQTVNDENLIGYRTVYLDTPSHEMYMAHHNGRKVREKIRVRTYVSSQLTFLEVKNKDNHGRTDKKRIRVSNLHSLFAEGGDQFLNTFSWYSLASLKPQLQNEFHRITLVDKCKTERLTIDLDLNFLNLTNKNRATMGNTVVVELKRDGRKESYVQQALHELHVRQANISKYCVGVSMTDSSVKHNRFKGILSTINKINN